jgi:hypothetical protein
LFHYIYSLLMMDDDDDDEKRGELGVPNAMSF